LYQVDVLRIDSGGIYENKRSIKNYRQLYKDV
jgi:hypothetical protein